MQSVLDKVQNMLTTLEITVLKESKWGSDVIPPQAKAFKYSFRFMWKNKIHKIASA